jgi:hypothetical protein
VRLSTKGVIRRLKKARRTFKYARFREEFNRREGWPCLFASREFRDRWMSKWAREDAE